MSSGLENKPQGTFNSASLNAERNRTPDDMVNICEPLHHRHAVQANGAAGGRIFSSQQRSARVFARLRWTGFVTPSETFTHVSGIRFAHSRNKKPRWTFRWTGFATPSGTFTRAKQPARMRKKGSVPFISPLLLYCPLCFTIFGLYFLNSYCRDL